MQVGRNITTNEMANMMRYSYLRGPGGRFRNPYDHGCKKNCSDFLINGYNDDIEILEAAAQSEGINMMPMSNSSLALNMPNGGHSAAAHSHQTNGNGHGHVNLNNKAQTDTHVHSSSCSHGNQSKPKTDSVPVGLGLGLGRGSKSRAAL